MTENITKEFVTSHTLMECLKEFSGAPNDPDTLKKYIEDHSLKGFREELLKMFEEANKLNSNKLNRKKEIFLTCVFQLLAAKMLYGGHFEIIGGGEIVRQIYIHTVEFYYHEEFNDDNAVHDYIVYHRNALDGENKYPNTIDPFPIGSLNAHQSGIDITFEDQAGKYRASALIRAYIVLEEGKEVIDKRSTYLYDYLFMNAVLPVYICWKNTTIAPDTKLKVIRDQRKNVYEYEDKNGKLTIEKRKLKRQAKLDHRFWAFSKDK